MCWHLHLPRHCLPAPAQPTRETSCTFLGYFLCDIMHGDFSFISKGMILFMAPYFSISRRNRLRKPISNSAAHSESPIHGPRLSDSSLRSTLGCLRLQTQLCDKSPKRSYEIHTSPRNNLTPPQCMLGRIGGNKPPYRVARFFSLSPFFAAMLEKQNF